MLFEAIPENVARVREALRKQLALLGLTTRQLADISIAVTEAVANSVRHAYRHQPQPGAVKIEAVVGDNTITKSRHPDADRSPTPKATGSAWGSHE